MVEQLLAKKLSFYKKGKIANMKTSERKQSDAVAKIHLSIDNIEKTVLEINVLSAEQTILFKKISQILGN